MSLHVVINNYYIMIQCSMYKYVSKPTSIFRNFCYGCCSDDDGKNKMDIGKAAFIHSVDGRYIIGTYLLQIWKIVKNVCSTFSFWMSILV